MRLRARIFLRSLPPLRSYLPMYSRMVPVPGRSGVGVYRRAPNDSCKAGDYGMTLLLILTCIAITLGVTWATSKLLGE